MQQEMSVTVWNNDRSRGAPGQLETEQWDAKERTRRALRISGIVFLIGVGCIFLPLVHFVLPPLCFLSAPAIFFFTRRQFGQVLALKGACPECAAPLVLQKVAVRFPLECLCDHCHGRAWVTEN